MHLHSTYRWQKLRLRQLGAEPLCRFCLSEDPPRVTEATVADHVTPHRGNERMFWSGELQSLCAPCHNQRKQSMEKGGQGGRRKLTITASGWPTH